MTLLHAFALGLLQGITEFLPVSSSGHLVLAETVLNVHIAPKDLQAINILLHAGTLLALLIAYADIWMNLLLSPFRKDQRHRRVLLLLIIATVPGAVAGFFLEEVIAEHFSKLLCVGIAFAVTGVVLLLGERSGTVRHSVWYRLLHPTVQEPHKLTTRSALFVGVAQAAALIPGLSRSGLTISAGRMMGLDRKDALEFSFLMVVPIIAGAFALSLLDLVSGAVVLPPANIVAVSVATSFVTSLCAILLLRAYVINRSFAWFAPYLFVLSAITIFLSMR